MKPNLRELAEFLRIVYQGRLVEASQIASWADDYIQREAKPEPAMLDLSMGTAVPRSELLERLSAVPGDSDDAVVKGLFFAYMRRLTATEAASAVFSKIRELQDFLPLSEEETQELQSVEYAYDTCAADPEVVEKRAGKDLQKFLDRYQKYDPPLPASLTQFKQGGKP